MAGMHAQCVLIYGVAMIILQIALKIAKIFLYNGSVSEIFIMKSMSHVTLSDKD